MLKVAVRPERRAAEPKHPFPGNVSEANPNRNQITY